MAGINLACVFLASGFSERFNGNKLTTMFGNDILAEHVLKKHPAEYFIQTVVVTRYPQIAICAAERSFTVCENIEEQNNIADTIKKGIAVLKNDIDGCMFCTCDMPFFSEESCNKLIEKFKEDKTKIVAAAENGERRSPVIFPQKYFEELCRLPFNTGGSYVIKNNRQSLILVDIPFNELVDIDTKEDLLKYRQG